jgi:CBS domain-containing protein
MLHWLLIRGVTAAVLIGLLAIVAFGGERVRAGTAAEDQLSLMMATLGALTIFEKVPPQPLRDLFHGAPLQEQAAPPKPKSAPRASAPPADLHPTPDVTPELPRLIGIVIATDIRAAYFLQDGSGRTLAEGDQVDDRYRVVRIEPKRVLLRDLSTGLFQTIDWGGGD